MTLIICALAAVVAAAAWHFVPAAREHHVGVLALMYTGASLMWCVDEIANAINGEPVLNLGDAAAMADDARLGIIIVAVGLVVWAIYCGFKTARKQLA